jgi:hypothetical protein
MTVHICVSREAFGRWVATSEELPGVRGVGFTRKYAVQDLERLIRIELGRRIRRDTGRDGHGQPLAHWYNLTLRVRRKSDEMIGFLRGIMADDEVSVSEVEKLAVWLYVNQEAVDCWPMDVVLDRVGQILEDGQITDEEREDLRNIIGEIVGAPDSSPFQTLTANLPLDNPPPLNAFPGKTFVFTGRFAWGTRSKLAREVEIRGGRCSDSVTRSADYVVIGTFGSRDWLHSAYGTKIETAVENRRRGLPVSIVSEEHWIKHVAGGHQGWNTSSAS